jgi:hypothetical protein
MERYPEMIVLFGRKKHGTLKEEKTILTGIVG